MAATLKIDGFDVSTHLRLQPDQGLDPADTDFLQPEFGDAGGGEGDPLISLGEHNRELAFPLTLNPAEAGYAASKDGLHQLVRDLQRRTKSAQVLEWRDDGATKSSFLDVVASRLEPEFHYRRGQHLYLQAVLRVWTRPYAHTATMWALGTAVATGIPIATGVIATGVDGDVDADIDVNVFFKSATFGFPASGGLFVGFSVQDGSQATWSIWRPAASMVFNNSGGTLAGASGAAASQALVYNLAGSNQTDMVSFFESTAGDYATATGGVRLVALARNRAAATLALSAFNVFSGPTIPLGATQMLPPGRQWRVVDLGVVRDAVRGYGIRAGVPSSTATSLFDLAGLLRLPEDHTIAAFCPISSDDAIGFGSGATHFFGRATAAMIERSTSARPRIPISGLARGVHPDLPIASSQPRVQGFAICDDGPQNTSVSVDVRVRERFTYHR